MSEETSEQRELRVTEISQRVDQLASEQESRELTVEESEEMSSLLDEFSEIEESQKADEEAQRSAKQAEKLAALRSRKPRESKQDEFESPEERHQGGSQFDLGDQLMAIRNVTSNQPTATLPMKQQHAIRAAAMNADNGCEGGFLLGKVFAKDLTRKMFDSSDMLSRVTKRTLPAGAISYELTLVDETSRQNGQRGGGLKANWTSGKRCDIIDTSKMSLSQVEITPRMLTAGLLECQSCGSSNELAQLVQEELPKEMAFAIEEAIMFGDGGKTPLGMLSEKNPALQTVPAKDRACSAYFLEDITALQAAYCGSMTTGIFVVNRCSLPALRCMKKQDSNESVNLLWMGPSGDASGRPYQELLGMPLVYDEKMPIFPAAGSIALVDPAQYIVVEREGGITGASSMHAFFLQNMMAYRFDVCINGRPKYACPVQAYADATKYQSPYVTLGAVTVTA